MKAREKYKYLIIVIADPWAWAVVEHVDGSTAANIIDSGTVESVEGIEEVIEKQVLTHRIYRLCWEEGRGIAVRDPLYERYRCLIDIIEKHGWDPLPLNDINVREWYAGDEGNHMADERKLVSRHVGTNEHIIKEGKKRKHHKDDMHEHEFVAHTCARYVCSGRDNILHNYKGDLIGQHKLKQKEDDEVDATHAF